MGLIEAGIRSHWLSLARAAGTEVEIRRGGTSRVVRAVPAASDIGATVDGSGLEQTYQSRDFVFWKDEYELGHPAEPRPGDEIRWRGKLFRPQPVNGERCYASEDGTFDYMMRVFCVEVHA